MNHLCVNTNFTCNVSNLCFSNLLFVLRFHNTFSPSFFFGSDFECPLLFKKFSINLRSYKYVPSVGVHILL